ncbi:hypothetical protein, partial [Alistipes putredinis]|uniref:hypothetical protein n=1 Tax=Alistipes putredinis TaxID=28117 RepID=UPI003AB8D0CB
FIVYNQAIGDYLRHCKYNQNIHNIQINRTRTINTGTNFYSTTSGEIIVGFPQLIPKPAASFPSRKFEFRPGTKWRGRTAIGTPPGKQQLFN